MTTPTTSPLTSAVRSSMTQSSAGRISRPRIGSDRFEPAGSQECLQGLEASQTCKVSVIDRQRHGKPDPDQGSAAREKWMARTFSAPSLHIVVDLAITNVARYARARLKHARTDTEISISTHSLHHSPHVNTTTVSIGISEPAQQRMHEDLLLFGTGRENSPQVCARIAASINEKSFEFLAASAEYARFIEKIVSSDNLILAKAIIDRCDAGKSLLLDYLAHHAGSRFLRALGESGVRFSLAETYACMCRGDPELVDVLLQFGPRPGRQALNIAVKTGDLALLLRLLVLKIRPDTSALTLAAKHRRQGMFQLLRIAGAPVDGKIFSRVAGNPQAMRLLVAEGLKPTVADLAAMIVQGKLDETRILLSALDRQVLLQMKPALATAIEHVIRHRCYAVLTLLVKLDIPIEENLAAVAKQESGASHRQARIDGFRTAMGQGKAVSTSQ